MQSRSAEQIPCADSALFLYAGAVPEQQHNTLTLFLPLAPPLPSSSSPSSFMQVTLLQAILPEVADEVARSLLGRHDGDLLQTLRDAQAGNADMSPG